MPKLRDFLRNSVRFRLAEPLRYAGGLARSALARGPRPIKVLLLSDQEVPTSEQQFAPLVARRVALRKELGIVLRRQLTSDALVLPRARLRQYDVVGLKLGFRSSAQEALRVARTVRAALAPRAKLVYFDGDDDLCILWPELLPLVDAYVKKHCFRERSEYRKSRIGKSNLTDYVARSFGTSFADDIIPESHGVAEDQLHKIVLGWNIGMDDKISALYAARPSLPSAASKDIDVVCRASVKREWWIHPLRAPVIPKIKSMAGDCVVLTPEQRVPQDVYYEEMLRSRVCVSPFGYGEICWRDFEAVLCGCVLVKPDMSHVDTQPNIFVADETYVPVRWDYSDLEAKLKELLAQPDRCERIRANAFGVLRAYIEENGATRRFEAILEDLGVFDSAAGPPG